MNKTAEIQFYYFSKVKKAIKEGESKKEKKTKKRFLKCSIIGRSFSFGGMDEDEFAISIIWEDQVQYGNQSPTQKK